MSSLVINNSLNPRGYYNPLTNFPILINGVGNQGDFFVATENATRDFGAGPVVIEKNDWVLLGRGLKWKSIKFGRGGGGGGDVGEVSIGALDGVVKSSQGATALDNVLFMQTADNTSPGLVSTGTQTFSGTKSFPSGIIANMTGVASGNAIIQGVPQYALLGMGVGNNIVGIPAPADSTQALFSNGANAYPEFRNITIPDFFPDDIITARGMRLSGIDGDERTMIVAGTSVLDNLTANTATITGLVAPTATITALTAQNGSVNILDVVTECTVPSELGTLEPTLKAVNYESLQKILDSYAPIPPDLSAYAKLLSPMFQGEPTAPTPSIGDDSDRLATTSFVNGIIDTELQLVIFPNGFCMQMGGAVDVGGSSEKTITLVKQFTKGWTVLTSLQKDSVGVNQPVGASFNGDYTAITIKNPNQSGAGVWWLACGYVDVNVPVGYIWKSVTPKQNASAYGISIAGGHFYSVNDSAGNYDTWRSTTGNGGSVWAKVNMASSLRNLAIGCGIKQNPHDDIRSLWANQGTFSTDNGLGFSQVTQSGISFANCYAMDINSTTNPSTIIYGSSTTGTPLFIKSSDNGSTFKNITAPALIAIVHFIGVVNGSYCWIAKSTTGIFYTSQDDGETWAVTPVTINQTAVQGIRQGQRLFQFGARMFNIPYCGSLYQSNLSDATLSYTDDGGVTWVQPQALGLPSKINLMTAGVVAGKVIYVASKGTSVYVSVDGMQTFQPTTLSAITAPVSVLKFIDGIFFAGLWGFYNNCSILNSTNGANWFPTDTSNTDGVCGSMEFNPSTNSIVCNGSSAFYSGGV